MSQSERSSGQVNSAYIEEGMALDGELATLSVEDFKNQGRTRKISKSQSFESDPQFELSVRRSLSKSNQDIYDGSVLDESGFQNQCDSPLIVETDKHKVADGDRSEFAGDFRKKAVIVSSDGRNGKERTRNLELVNNNGDETTKSSASQNNQRLSPLKLIGGFLFPGNVRKLNRTKEGSSLESPDGRNSGNINGCGSRDDKELPK